MKFALTTAFLLAPFFAFAGYNPAVKALPGHKVMRKISSTNDGDVCLKKAENFVRASVELILGKGQISSVVWLSEGHALKADGTQDPNKWAYEFAVTSKAATKGKKDADVEADWVVDIHTDAKCAPLAVRFYDAKSDDWKNDVGHLVE